MDIDLISTIKLAIPIFKEISISVAGAAIWESFRKKLTETEKDKFRPLNKFIEEVDQCMQQAAKEADVKLTTSTIAEYRKTWLKSIFSNISHHQVIGYLPNFMPVVVLKKLLEDDLKQNIEEEKHLKFINNFNQQLAALDYNLIPKFETDSTIDRLNAYLKNVQETIENNMTPFEKLVYIEPYGVICSTDNWNTLNDQTVKDHDNKNIKKADKLIEKYFEEKLYKGKYHYPILFLCADFGIGKSCFIKNHVLNLIKRFVNRADGFIPVYFEFKEYDKPERLIDYLEDNNLLSKNIPELILFLDGLDSISPLNTDRIKNAIDSLEGIQKNIPKGSRIIISTRPILGESGFIADYIQQYQNGYYLHLFGFIKPDQIDEWFSQLSGNNIFSGLNSINFNKLKQLGVSEDLFTKPLSLTIISNLIQNSPDNQNLSSINKTGLYLSYLDSLTAQIAKSAKEMGGDLKLKQANIRNLLQKIAAIANLKEKKLDVQLIETCENDDINSVFRSYKDNLLSAQTIFKGNETDIEFIHPSFKEILLAEYLFSVFIKIAALDENTGKKVYLCVGEVSEETINFLRDIVLIAFAELKIGSSQRLLGCFFDAIKATYPEVRFEESLANNVIAKAKKIIINAEPVLLKINNDAQSIETIFNHSILKFLKPDFYFIVYQERWISLKIITILYKLHYGMHFFEDNKLDNDLSEAIYQLLVKTPSIPIWAKKLLPYINLSSRILQNIDLSQADLSYSSLNNTDLTGANLKNSVLNNSEIKSAKLIHTDLSGAHLSHCDFTLADLTYAVVVNADLHESEFKNAILEGTSFKGSDLRKAEFRSSTIRCTNFEGTKLFGTHFIDLDLFNSSFEDADLIDREYFAKHTDRDDYSEQEFIERSLNLINVNHDNKTLHDYQRNIMNSKIKSVFVSYNRKDLNEVREIVSMLQMAGIPVWQDIDSLDAGLTEDQVRTAIWENCVALVFYATSNSIVSDFIRDIELKEAYRKFKNDPKFSIVPIFKESIDKVNATLKGVIDGDISRFNGVVVEPGKSLMEISQKLRSNLLNSVLGQSNEKKVQIAVMTYAPTPDGFNPILNLDWSDLHLPSNLLSQSSWADYVRPALLDIKKIIVKSSRTNLEIFSKAQPQVGIAFGYIFRKEAGFVLNVHHFDQTWSTLAEETQDSYLYCKDISGDLGSKNLAVIVSITQEVGNVTGKLSGMDIGFRAFLNCSPISGDIPYHIPDGSVASVMAGEIRKAILDVKRKYEITDIHIFSAIPLALAYLIGWRLNACGRIHLYDYDRSNGTYTPSWILEGAD